MNYLLKNSLVVTLENIPVQGNALPSVMIKTFETYWENNPSKDSGVGCLLISCIDDMQRDNERLKTVKQ